MLTGIYMIRCLYSSKIYIGQTIHLPRRKAEHLYKLRKGLHKNPKLQNLFNKYGEDSLSFELVCKANQEDLNDFEEILICFYKENDPKNLVNILSHPYSLRGYKHSEEIKEKMRQSKASISAETRANMSKAHTGKSKSEETKRKLSLAMQGKILSSEHKDKISKAMVGTNNPRHRNYIGKS